MIAKELIKKIEKSVVESDGKKKFYCTKAFELAKEYGVELKDIGQYCNDNNIRIAKCQLGCFQ